MVYNQSLPLLGGCRLDGDDLLSHCSIITLSDILSISPQHRETFVNIQFNGCVKIPFCKVHVLSVADRRKWRKNTINWGKNLRDFHMSSHFCSGFLFLWKLFSSRAAFLWLKWSVFCISLRCRKWLIYFRAMIWTREVFFSTRHADADCRLIESRDDTEAQ